MMDAPLCDGEHRPMDCGDPWCDVRMRFLQEQRGDVGRNVDAAEIEREKWDRERRAHPNWSEALGRIVDDEIPASTPRLPNPIDVKCDTCKASPGVMCNVKAIPGSMDGFHAARVRLVGEGKPATRTSERDEYNMAVRSRERSGSTPRGRRR